MALCCGSKDSVNNPSAKYHPDQKQSETVLNMEFRHVPEPQVSELANYVRQRREHVVIPSLATTSDVRAEITRNVTERTQPIDQYPKGRQFLNDEEYLLILKDLLNLSNILDDMEQTGWVPYANRSAYYSECPGGDACGQWACGSAMQIEHRCTHGVWHHGIVIGTRTFLFACMDHVCRTRNVRDCPTVLLLPLFRSRAVTTHRTRLTSVLLIFQLADQYGKLYRMLLNKASGK